MGGPLALASAPRPRPYAPGRSLLSVRPGSERLHGLRVRARTRGPGGGTLAVMSLKIDQDHSRFRNIVRGRIRQNLRKYISQGELIGRKGKDLVSIPIPQIDI